MKVYLASWFGNKTKMKLLAKELRRHGIEVTSRWLEEKVPQSAGIKDVTRNHLERTAILDIEDILAAETVVLVMPADKDYKKIPKPSWARGGRHFETGFQYGLMKTTEPWRRLIICGKDKENVFHYLPEVEHVSSKKKLIKYLLDTDETI